MRIGQVIKLRNDIYFSETFGMTVIHSQEKEETCKRH